MGKNKIISSSIYLEHNTVILYCSGLSIKIIGDGFRKSIFHLGIHEVFIEK